MKHLFVKHKVRQGKKGLKYLDSSVYDSLGAQAIARMDWWELLYLQILQRCRMDIVYFDVESMEYKSAVNFLRTNPYGYFSDEIHFQILELAFSERRAKNGNC